MIDPQSFLKNRVVNKKKLTIIFITYNHEEFVAQALDSILLQETGYSFQVLAYDDASTDGTRQIVQSYCDKYPDIFIPVLPDENLYSQGVRPVADILLPLCNSEYVATLEGDDAWTDPDKLQKQITFLDANPDYVLAVHDVTSICEKNKVIEPVFLPDFYRKDFTGVELQKCWGGIMTQTAMYRNVLGVIPSEFHKAFSGDLFLASLLGAHGKSKFMFDISPSLYRRHVGGVFTSLDPSLAQDMQALNFFWLYRYYRRTENSELAEFYKQRIGQKLGLVSQPSGTF